LENTLDKHFINIKGFINISYERMFVSIKGMAIEKVEKYYRVYYRIGRIYKTKKTMTILLSFFKKDLAIKE